MATARYQKNNQPDPTMGMDDAAAYLGLAKGTLYNWCAKGKIKFYKPSPQKTIFRKSDLDEFLEQRAVDAVLRPGNYGGR
jgi:excisionase family DNA binding protein